MKCGEMLVVQTLSLSFGRKRSACTRDYLGMGTLAFGANLANYQSLIEGRSRELRHTPKNAALLKHSDNFDMIMS